jgi:SAM-dependent methyltransferase
MVEHQDFYNAHKPKSTEGIFSHILELVPQDGGVAYDLCCGTGILTNALAERAFQSYGLDIANLHIGKNGQAAHAYIVADVNKLPFADEQADLITFVDSLQYFAKPQATIAEIARLTKPGGYLILSTQNNYNLAGVKKWLIHKVTGESWSPWLRHPIENAISYPQLVRILEDAGFEIEYVRGKQFLTAWVSLLPSFIRNWSAWPDKPWRSLASVAGRTHLPQVIEESLLARFAMIVLLKARKKG